MNHQVRFANIDDDRDLEGIAAIVNQFDQQPSTAEDIRRIFTHLPPGRITCRLAAVNETGQISGYACAVHEAFSPKGSFYAWVGVDAGARRQGAGRALREALWAQLAGFGAGTLYSEVKDDDPVSMQFAEKHGFAIERHLFHSHLDLGSFDERPFAGLIDKLTTEGIRFLTLADEGDTRQARRTYYELDKICTEDIPGYLGPFMEFEEYEKRMCDPEVYHAEGCQVAADGDRYVGFAHVVLVPTTGNAHNHMTGVHHDYRGRGIALALKLLAIRYARKQGAHRLTTSNDSSNAPMLAVNRKLGYVPETGIYTLKNDHPDFK